MNTKTKSIIKVFGTKSKLKPNVACPTSRSLLFIAVTAVDVGLDGTSKT